MKKLSLLFLSIIFCLTIFAQADYTKYMASAKTSYTKPDLEDARYNLMLALQQLDMKVGQEILKILPEKMDSSFCHFLAFGASRHRGYAH